jgi:hypothetical protein
MHRRKSNRHQRAAKARWRADRAQAERDAGIPDRPMPTDCREPITIDLRSAGGPLLTLEPCLGKIAWKVREGDQIKDRAALKTLLHRIADGLPRQLGERASLSL